MTRNISEIVFEETYIEVDNFHFPFESLTGILALTYYSLVRFRHKSKKDMETHAGNMEKDQDETLQDENKSQKCGLCSYSCKKPSVLKRHMMVHIGHKAFTCKQCDHSFARASDLKQHELAHSGEKPFKCSHCNFSCTSQ